MKNEIKQQWLAALRGGTYSQARSCLHKNDEFCCLGVLCDLVAPDKWIPAHGGTSVFGFDVGAGDIERLTLPGFVMGACGFPNGSPTIDVPKDNPMWTRLQARDAHGYTSNFKEGKISLAALNDYGFSFAEIADLIEAFIPGE